MIAMRIAKYPHLPSMGYDVHSVVLTPLPGPVPPLPPLPSAPFLVTIINMASPMIFGKFTFQVITEFMADTLAGHDWGMMQMHLCMAPGYQLTPSNITTTLGSSHKYFLPSYAVQQSPTGGLMQMVGRTGSAVAVTTPVGIISLQDCADVGGVGFAAPTGIGSSLATTRWVGFGWADFFAGMISMAADAAAAAVMSKIGGLVETPNLPPGAIDVTQTVFTTIVGLSNGLLTTTLNAQTTNGQATALGGALGVSIIATPAAIGLVGGKLADYVGGLGVETTGSSDPGAGGAYDPARTDWRPGGAESLPAVAPVGASTTRHSGVTSDAGTQGGGEPLDGGVASSSGSDRGAVPRDGGVPWAGDASGTALDSGVPPR